MQCECCDRNMVEILKSREYLFYRCKFCGFWTTRQHSGQYPVYDYIDAGTYDYNADTSFHSLAEEARCIMINKLEAAGRQEGGVFLDVGCSEGVYVYAMQSLGWEAYGFEIDAAKVERARAKQLSVMHPSDSPFMGPGGVDFILIRHTIEHIPDFMTVLRTAAQLLAEEGVL